MSNFVICGFKRAGKTTFARQLAEKLQLTYVDTDVLIAEDCAKFYLKHGAEVFRRVEKEALLSIQGIQNAVVATGGGAVLDPENIGILKKIGPIVYLEVEKEELKKRVFTPPLPAFIRSEEEFEAVYAKRIPIYAQIADITVSWPAIRLEQFLESRHGGNRTERRLGS